MTETAPKPIEDCPNPECKHFCAMYEAPFVSNDGLMHKVKCDDCADRLSAVIRGMKP